MKNKVFSTYTGWIVLANIISFVIMLILGAIFSHEKLISWIALQPSAVLTGKNLWTFITSIFTHAGVFHLAANMVSLIFIGAFVERLIGKKRFITFYFIAGIIAGLFFVLIAYLTKSNIDIYAVGASGALFGLGGLIAVLTPKLPVLVFFIIPMPMWAAMIFLLGGLWLISATAGIPIGNTAHLGGLIVGVLYGFYLRKKYPKKTKMISKYFSK